jgi:1-acyl-sn-glycerol-3-phosphate acyltransferase
MSVFVFAAMDYVRLALRTLGRPTLLQRGQWLHRWSPFANRVIGLHLQCQGAPPTQGMIVSNHLSYLDILAYSAVAPCVFVAKQEVAGWPILGLFARMAGTIFVDRKRRMEAGETNLAIANALRQGAVIVLFPEGTSSAGHSVLPFHSSLFESPAQLNSTISPASIQYELSDGSVSEEVCYWGEMTLAPHLLKLLRKPTVRTRIAFGQLDPGLRPCSRKQIAGILHHAVLRLFAHTL